MNPTEPDPAGPSVRSASVLRDRNFLRLLVGESVSHLGIAGATIGGWLGDTIGPRRTVLVAAIGYTVPFFWSLFTPLRAATTEQPAAAAE